MPPRQYQTRSTRAQVREASAEPGPSTSRNVHKDRENPGEQSASTDDDMDADAGAYADEEDAQESLQDNVEEDVMEAEEHEMGNMTANRAGTDDDAVMSKGKDDAEHDEPETDSGSDSADNAGVEHVREGDNVSTL